MSDVKQILFIVNPNAGKKKQINPDNLLQYIPAGYNAEVVFTKRALHATALAADAVKNKFDFCIAVGGDGTINEVAAGLLHSKTVMGILPIGSGNGLARHLNLPFNVKDNIGLISNGKIVMMDAIRINDKLSVNISGLGFEAHVADVFSKRSNRGLWGYLSTIFKTVFSYKSFDVSILADGFKHEQNVFSLAIANASQYGNNVFIAPEASVNDEAGNLVLIQKPPLLKAMVALPALFQKKIHTSTFIHNIKFKQATIHTLNVAWHVDGEPCGHTHIFNIEVIPAALMVLIPAHLYKY